MEPHSLVLTSASTLDAHHAGHHVQLHSIQPRKPQPLRASPPMRRPLRNLAQGLARGLAQLRQFSQRLRGVDVVVPHPADSDDSSVPSTSAPSCSYPSVTIPVQSPHIMGRPVRNWRAPWRAGRRLASAKLGPAQTSQQLLLQSQRPNDGSQLEHRDQLDLQQLQTAVGEADSQAQAHHNTEVAGLQQLQGYDLQLHHQQQQQQQLSQEQEAASQGSGQNLQVEEGPQQLQMWRRGPLRRLRRALHFVGAHLGPQGPGENDKTRVERVLNVATCACFFQAGGKMIRLCRSLAARRFGWAFMAVGAIATVYHGSWGRFRPLARKVDYWSIALASMLLRSAVVGPVPRWLTAAMLVTIPFKPTVVTSSNFSAVEVRYLLLALSQRALLPEWGAHAGMTVAATACFALDESPLLSWFKFSHAAFHALSAAAFLTLPSALNHITMALPSAAAA